jgi:GNAT superfamily N-acetyltransferase
MHVALIDSVDDFIAATTSFRAADPLRTNVIGSVSLAVSTGRSSYAQYHWWVVRDADEVVVGAAMRTSPFNMILSPMPLEGARSLGAHVGTIDDAIPGVTGPTDLVAAFIEGYRSSKSPGSSRRASEQRRDLLYELVELVTPDVEGLGRPVRSEEIEPVANMLLEFNREVALPSLSLNDAREGVTKSVAAGSLFGWDVDSDIVSIAGHAPVVRTASIDMARVGPVFTPPAYRRRGFASAVTAHVTRHLLERGARVMLFTDAANPTSNAIYHDIGYRLVDELVAMRFA